MESETDKVKKQALALDTVRRLGAGAGGKQRVNNGLSTLMAQHLGNLGDGHVNTENPSTTSESRYNIAYPPLSAAEKTPSKSTVEPKSIYLYGKTILKAKKLGKLPTQPSEYQGGRKLDTLPFEVLHQILGELDPQTVANFSKMSRRAYGAANSVFAYRDLNEYAPELLPALGKAGLADRYTLPKLHATLMSQECVSCGQFGGLLYMPTCVPLWLPCMRVNRNFRVITLKMARQQRINLEHLHGAVTLFRRNNLDHPGDSSAPRESFRTSVDQAIRTGRLSAAQKSLCVDTLINRAEVVSLSPSNKRQPCQVPGCLKCPKTPRPVTELHPYDNLFNFDSPPPPHDPVIEPAHYSRTFEAMATVPVISLRTDRTVETGHRCAGCRIIKIRAQHGVLPKDVRLEIEGPLRRLRTDFHFCERIRQIYLWNEERLFTEKELEEHQEHCSGCLKRVFPRVA